MATVTSSIAGTTTTYVITDQKSNTLTIAAAAPGPAGGGITYTSSGALLGDGQEIVQTLMTMLVTGLRPNVIVGTNASFSN